MGTTGKNWIVFMAGWIISMHLYECEGITGHDCSYNHAVYSKIDLTTVGSCNKSSLDVQSTSVRIQLVQLSDLIKTTAYTCSVSVTRHITYCGMHSHSSEVSQGLITYPYSLNREKCLHAILHGELCLFCGTSNELSYTGLQVSQTRRSPTMFG